MHHLKTFPGPLAQALKRTRGMFVAGAVLAMTAQGASAACTYTIDNEWNTGFVATITIKNDTGAAVNGWNINWTYSANRITSSWNANLTGSNPYTATNLGWNGNIAAGQSVSFGFQGNKNGATAERPTINGTVCAGGTVSSVRSSSVVPSSVPSSSVRSSVVPSSSTPSSVASSSSVPSSTPVTSSSRSSAAPTTRKFVGNITTSGAVRSDFINYWNQITPENEGKWGSVEATRDVYNWAPVDRIYAYAREHNIPVKAHTFVWGSQFPSWITNLSASEQAAEIEEWIRDYCTRYPDTALIDVVNEATPGHAPAEFARNAFGNDWIIKSFQLARKYCPNAVLILNDYNVLSWNTAEFIAMATPAINAGVVDALGMQAHGLADRPLAETTSKLNQIAALGLPIYISEYDIEKTNDQEQLQVMQQQFPLFYNHASVKGITLWGYVVGKTWRDGTGLIQENGTPRPAMTWLMNYLKTATPSSQSSAPSSVASSSRSSQSSAVVSSSSSVVIVPSSSSSSSLSSSLRSSSSSSIISTRPELVYAINSGGGKVNYNGVEYLADRFSTGGTANSTTDNISNVAEPALFQSELYGTFGYEIPVTNSTYTVELHFAEIYHTTVGQRSFNVSVEGKQEMSQVDLYSLIGADAAYTYTVNNVQVTDGKLNINLQTLVDNGTLAGFAIYSSTGGKFVEPPVVDPGSASKENEGADCVLGAAPAAASNAKLPDPFKKYNGSRIAAKSEWRCQRQETLKQIEASIYGTKPGKPESVTGTVTNTQITVNVSHQGKTASFTAKVERPANVTGPVPAVVVLGGFGADTATIRAEGVAVITYDPYVVGAESGSRTNKTGAFYTIYGNRSTTGLLAAWAWGVSRIIDVLEQSGTTVLKPDAIGVTGCSRFGKGAFAIGALDQRIALTMPIESGSGGVPIWRGIPGEGAQSPSSAYGETYWLGDAFSNYTADTKRLPVDTHQIIALVAPRGLYIMDNPHIANLGPKSAHAAALAGAEVYKALGATSSITYLSNIADGSHCAIRPEFKAPLQSNIRRFLKKESATTGGLNPRSNATANKNDWVDWTTPTLN